MWEGCGSARGSEWRPRGAGGGSATLEGVEGGSATLEGGEEAAAWLWRAGSLRRQRDSGRRGGGGNAAPEGGEEAAARPWPIYGGQGGGGSAAMAYIWRAGYKTIPGKLWCIVIQQVIYNDLELIQVEVGLGADQVHWCQAGWTLASDRPRAAHTSDGGSCERER